MHCSQLVTILWRRRRNSLLTSSSSASWYVFMLFVGLKCWLKQPRKCVNLFARKIMLTTKHYWRSSREANNSGGLFSRTKPLYHWSNFVLCNKKKAFEAAGDSWRPLRPWCGGRFPYNAWLACTSRMGRFYFLALAFAMHFLPLQRFFEAVLRPWFDWTKLDGGDLEGSFF